MTKPNEPTWANWNGNVEVFAGRLEQPRDLDEVVVAVKKARAEGLPIRVVGGGHSWSNLTALKAGGVLLSLEKLRGIVAADPQTRRIRVLGGTRLFDLNDALAAMGYGLSNLGSIDQQSVAGVVSTATHGTGIRFGNLSTQVTALTFVDGTGEIHRVTEADGDLLAAMRCGLGSLGVITEVTLQCEAAFNLRGIEEKWPIDKALDALPDLIAAHEHFKLWWLPHTSTGIVFKQDRTPEPAQPKPMQSWLRNHFLKNHVFRTGMAAASRVSGGVPAFNKVLAAGSASRTEVVDRSDKVFTFPVHTPHEEMEIAIPMAHAADAFNAMRQLIEREKIHVGFIVEMRFVRGDDIWLSPAFGRDSCYLGALQYKALPHEAYFAGFADLMSTWGGRPHWGKVHSMDAAGLRPLYPNWDRFLALREQLDPDQLFCNPELRRIFGL